MTQYVVPWFKRWLPVAALLSVCAHAVDASDPIVVGPTDDTYVRGGPDADTNFASKSRLRVKNASGEQNDRHTLLRFDLSTIAGTVVSATLELTCSNLSNGSGAAAFVYAVQDDAWQEDTVTWNTAPDAVDLLDAHESIDTVGETYAFDVTSFVAQELAGDRGASFLIRDDLQVAKTVDFATSESGDPPRLVIELQTYYLVDVAVVGAGLATLSPAGGTYPLGTTVALAASPDSGWQFLGWSGDVTSSANPNLVTVNADMSITATFAPLRSVAITVTGYGTVSLDPPGGSYADGTVVTATATPAPGWSFLAWADGAADSNNTRSITIESDVALGATFESGPPMPGQIVFQDHVTGDATNDDHVATKDVLGVLDELYVAAISSRPFQPVTSISGLGLTWTLMAEQCSARGTSGVSMWTAMGTDASTGGVTAQLNGVADLAAMVVSRYAGADTTQPVSMLGSANQNGTAGTCLDGPDAEVYSIAVDPTAPHALVLGAIAHLDPTHEPAVGWHERHEFHHGTPGTGVSVSLVERVWDSADVLTMAGIFSDSTDWAAAAMELRPGPEKAVQLTTVGQGTVQLLPSGGAYPVQTIVSLTPQPDAGWWFVGWDADLQGHANPTSVLMNDDIHVRATFSTTPHYDLDLQINGVGHVNVVPPGLRYAVGTAVTVSVDVPDGWIFTGWDGDLTGKSSVATLAMDANRTVNASFQHVGPRVTGLWTSAAELAQAPMQGDAWERLLEAANTSFYPPDVANQDSNDNVCCLAAAIVYARTGNPTYLESVEHALEFLPSLGNPGSATLAWAREVGAYALAADLVGYRSSALDTWLREMAVTYVGLDGRTLEETFRERPNNWGTHSFGTLAAVFAYLDDAAMLEQLRDSWILSVTTGAPDAMFGELSWHADPATPRAINPPGAFKQGLDIDGAITDDIRRGGPFAIPPHYTGYPWEALQGLVMAARVLERYDPELSIWQAGDRAIYRAAHLLQVTWEEDFGGWAAQRNDMWMLPFLDAAYGTQWAVGRADEYGAGKNTGWAYVLAESETGNPPTSTIPGDPVTLRVHPSFPNPFHSDTSIRFDLPTAQHVRVCIYDVMGRRVTALFDGPCPPGRHLLRWTGSSSRGVRVASGIYWCQFEVGRYRQRVRLTLLR